MTNKELETKIKEIIEIENFFDMTEAMLAFEKDYKASDFYKKTKMPLVDVIKAARLHYGLQFDTLKQRLQKLINSLDITRIDEILGQMVGSMNEENEEMSDSLETLKQLMGKHEA